MPCKRSQIQDPYTAEPAFGECQCIGHGIGLRFVCPHWHEPERKMDQIDRWEIEHWNKIDKNVRMSLVTYLRHCVPEHVRLEWADQAKRGMSIGCTDVRFHLGVGMAVRNALRKILLDKDLPAGTTRNWDDFYRGALYALVEDPKKDGA